MTMMKSIKVNCKEEVQPALTWFTKLTAKLTFITLAVLSFHFSSYTQTLSLTQPFLANKPDIVVQSNNQTLASEHVNSMRLACVKEFCKAEGAVSAASIAGKALRTVSEEQRQELANCWIAFDIDLKTTFLGRNKLLFGTIFLVLIFIIATFVSVNRYLKKQIFQRTIELETARDEALKNEKIFRSLFQNNAAVKIIIDSETNNIIDANESATQFYGWSREQLKQMNIWQINTLSPEEIQQELAKTKSVKKVSSDYKHRKADGSIVDVRVFGSRVLIGDKQLIYSIIQDISEIKKTEDALRAQEEIFRHFMEHSPVYVFFKDKNIRSVKLSKNYEQMLNKPLDELLGKSMDDLFPSDLAKAMIADDQKILAEGKAITVDEDFNGRHYTTIKFPFVIDGKQQYLAGYTIDVTERRKAEEELIELKNKLETKVEDRTKELNEQIQKLDKSQKAMVNMVEDLNNLTAKLQEEQRKLLISNRELEAFTYSVSHDLRAPLRHINGYVDLLNEKFRADLPEKAQYYLSTVTDATRQMGTLIDDLLQLSRMGRQEVRKTKIEMNALVKEVLERIKQDIEKREITWKVQELPQVPGDYPLLKQVWVNLLDNAVKYTRNTKKAEISICFKEDEKDFIFYIRDNGVGFNMKYAHKLFGVFQRLHSQTEFKGTGIGLANVQRIIHKHNGRVWAEAESGKGAVFYFSLPKSP